MPKTTKIKQIKQTNADLALHIAAILENPETPDFLYNGIVDAMADLYSAIPARQSTDTPETIERILNWHQGLSFCNITKGGR